MKLLAGLLIGASVAAGCASGRPNPPSANLDAQQHERFLVNEAPNTGGKQPPHTLKNFLSALGRQNLTYPQQGESWTPQDASDVVNWIAGTKLVP